jgi:hypothetical protein
MLIAYTLFRFHQRFQNNVKSALLMPDYLEATELTESAIQMLPGPVKKSSSFNAFSQRAQSKQFQNIVYRKNQEGRAVAVDAFCLPAI